MKSRIVIIFILLFPLLGFSQGEFNNWFFGALAGVNFNSASPVVRLDGQINSIYPTTCISDSIGNSLLYSDGSSVWNKINTTMYNGTLLDGNLNTQQPVFGFQHPSDDSLYYLFTMDFNYVPWVWTTNGLRYSIVDLRIDGGLGGIDPTNKNVFIPQAQDASNALFATRASNNKDVWVVVRKHRYGPKIYASYKVTSGGFNPVPVLSTSSVYLEVVAPFDSANRYAKKLKISPNGLKLCCEYTDVTVNPVLLEYCEFNSKTGSIEPLFTFRPPQNTYFGECSFDFSGNSKLFYLLQLSTGTGGGTTTIYQYDATQKDSLSFVQSAIQIGTANSISTLQMGPNGKMYLGKVIKDSLSSINFPNITGVGCGFQDDILSLQGRNHLRGLPQFLQKYKAYINQTGQCQRDSVHFTSDIWPPADTIRWDFGDPASGGANISNLAAPSHLFSNPGTYTVELYVRHNDNRTDTTWRSITILPSPQPALGPDQTILQGNTATFDAGSCTGCTYQWANLTLGQPNIGTGQTYSTGVAGVYMVSVTSPNGCVGRDTVQLNVIPPNPGNQGAYEFWFAAPEISYQTIPPAPLIIQGFDRPIKLVFTTSEGPAAIKIEEPANSSFIPIYDTVITDVLKVIDLTPFIDIIENKPSNAVLNFGLHITSTKPVTVYYEVQSDHNSDDFSLKGLNALGTEFIVPAQNRFPNYNYCNPSARNSFTVVATDDSTTVQVIPSRDIEGHIKKDTFSVLLNRGQTWCGKALYRDAANHLGGSFILSNKPISVTVADDAIFDSVATGFPVNLAGDQLIPRHLCGNQYILYTLGLPSSQLSDETVAYVYAFENSTEIYLNGVFKQIINRGDFYSCSLSTDSITSAFISASKTIFVYESLLYPGGSFAQSAGAVVPPIGCTGSKRVTFSLLGPLIGSYGYDLFFTTETSNIGNIALYQPPFPPFIPPASSYDTVPGTNNEYVSLRTSIGVLPGFSTYTVYCPTGKFQLAEISHSIQYYARTAFLSDFSSLNLGVDRNICPGDSTLLDAGFGRNSYLWNTGDTTQTIWIKVPGTYWVNTTEPGCNLSDTIVISNYPFTLVNLGSDRQICTGDSVLLNAGAGRAWYLWSNGESTQTIWAKNPGSYWVTVPDVHCIVSDTVLVSTTTAPVVTNIPPLSKTICTGESTNIPLFGNELGIMFHWTATLTLGNISGFSLDSGLVINQILINNGATAGIVTYHITPKIGDCAGTPVDYAVTVNVGDPVDISITASTNTICAGTTVTFTATPINPGTNPAYQWKVNGVNNGSNAPTFVYVPANGDIVKCILTSSNVVCISNNPATSNTITMVVNPLQPVSVSVSQSANPVCTGATVNLTAIPFNGGSTPQYQWKVNGLIAGTNSPSYSYVPVNGDAVTCTLTSNVLCPSGNPAISPTVTMTVNPNLPVGVSIVASSNPFCAGSPVTLTASPVNGGTSPGYQWKVNGINAGTNSPVLIYSPANGDVVTCSLLSSETCTLGNPAQSNPVTMVVNANLPAGITIAASANPFCPGSSVTFNAIPTNGGSTPSYQWKVNGINAGTNSSTLSYNPIDNDSVRCIITSNLNCVTGNPASSSKIIMSGTLAPIVTFSSCFDTLTTINAKPFKLKGGIPLGGTYSGPGVNSPTGFFTPSTAGTGTKIITYSYMNVSLCSASKSRNIIVQSVPLFVCGNNLTDIRDNKIYPSVQIGSQCWMAVNLNHGNIILSSQVQNDNCIAEKYCYNDLVTNCTNYGGLYQWDEMMKYDDTQAGQGFCPPGWHVPTENEWQTLFNYYNGNGFAGKPLQDSIISGFNALRSGVFYLNSSMSFNGFATLFWSSTSWGQFKALSHGMNTYNYSVSLYPSSRANAFPVRCLRD